MGEGGIAGVGAPDLEDVAEEETVTCGEAPVDSEGVPEWLPAGVPVCAPELEPVTDPLLPRVGLPVNVGDTLAPRVMLLVGVPVMEVSGEGVPVMEGSEEGVMIGPLPDQDVQLGNESAPVKLVGHAGAAPVFTCITPLVSDSHTHAPDSRVNAVSGTSPAPPPNTTG